jgi:hypothetical protein
VSFNLYDIVVVTALNVPTRAVTGTASPMRQPRVGDEGTVVHVLGPQDVIVESVDDQGLTVCLADFRTDELGSAQPK